MCPNSLGLLSNLNPIQTSKEVGFAMFTSSGRHIQITARRFCQKCQDLTEQVCHKVRYQDNGTEQEGELLKKSYWICSVCVTEVEEVKVQQLPGDKVRIIHRLLRMQDDYAIQSMKIASSPERLIVEITVKESVH